MVPYPEVPARARRLMEGVRKAGIGIHAARSFPRELILRVHTRRYLQFLESAYGEWAGDEAAFPELVASLRPLERPATYPRHILGRAGWHMKWISPARCLPTPSRRCRASADTALTAASLVPEGDRYAYALCRPPGHHAYPDRAGGCAISTMSRSPPRRCANATTGWRSSTSTCITAMATQAIFYNRADVLTVSIHADPRDFYPFYYGHEHQTGQGEGQGFNIKSRCRSAATMRFGSARSNMPLAAIEGYAGAGAAGGPRARCPRGRPPAWRSRDHRRLSRDGGQHRHRQPADA